MASKKPSLTGLTAKRTTGKRNVELDHILSLGEVEEVDLSLVDRDEGQPRPLEEVMEGIEAFADEIERDNFVLAQLPVYHIEENGRRTIVVGERRTAAFRLKGREKIPAICKRFTPEERERIFVLQYVENDTDLKKPLSPMADARWWRVYADRYHNGNISAAAAARGKAQADISNRLTLLDAPEYIQQFINDNRLKDPATFAALIRLAKRGGDALAGQVISDYRDGLVKGSFRAHIEALAKATREQASGEGQGGTSKQASNAKTKKPEASSSSESQETASQGGVKNVKVTESGEKKKPTGLADIKKVTTLLGQIEFAHSLAATDPGQYDLIIEKLAESINLLRAVQTQMDLDRARTLAVTE